MPEPCRKPTDPSLHNTIQECAHCAVLLPAFVQGNAAAVAAALQQLVNPMVATALQQLTHSSGWEADAAAGQPQVRQLEW